MKSGEGQLSTGNFTQYTYDAENRLTKVEDFLAGNPTPFATSTYRYDGLGRRIEKVANGQTTRYIYDGEDMLLEYDGSNVLQARYTHGPGIDEPIAVTKGSSTFFYHQDGLGTVTDLTDSAGATAKSYSYDAYGNLVDQTGTVDQPYTYTGREFDSESGLMYYRARYYDPQIGRFLSQDPIGFFGGINLYQYVEGNPARFNDPTGLLENFTFELNNTPMSNLTCECGRSFPAFSGDADATNDPGATNIPDFGPIPKGSYYIVDRPSGGRLGRLREFISGSDKWYALYRDDGVIDDNSSVDGVTRGQYRLHSGTRSAGCITLQNADDFKKLRDLLSKTKKGKIPGTNIDYYGRVTVR